MSRTKLFLSKFASDVTWLLVASVQKQTVFDVRSIEKKLVYQILDTNFSPYSSSVQLSGVNFRIDGETTISTVFPFVPVAKDEAPPVQEVTEEEDPLERYELTELRRSKRRNVQPERYLGEIGLEATDTTALRIGYKFWNPDDLAIVLVNEDDANVSVLEDPQQNVPQTIEEYSEESTRLISKIGVEAKEENLIMNFRSEEMSKDGDAQQRKRKYVKREKESKGKNVEKEKQDKYDHLAIVPLLDESNQMPREQSHLLNEIRQNPLDIDDDNVPLKFYKRRFRERRTTTTTSTTARMKKISELDDYYDNGPVYGRKNSTYKQCQKNKHRPISSSSRSDKYSDDPSRKKKTLDISVYKDLISTYMKNIQLTIENKLPISTDAWKNLQGASAMYEKKAAADAAPAPEEEEEESETEMLFRELELCLASAYYEEVPIS